MKKILLAFVALMMICSCNDQVCKITGTLTDPVDSVRLMDMTGKELDVAAVKDGTFVLQCSIDPEMSVTILRGEGYDPVNLIPDSKKIKVSLADGTTTITGSPLSQELQTLVQWLMTTFFESNDKMMALEEAGDTLGANAVGLEMSNNIASHCREVYQAHKSDAIGVQALGIMMNFIDKDEFIELYEQGGKNVQNDASIGGYYEYLKAVPEESVITLLDNGDILQEQAVFEDYVGVGNYTLVDFWASWCGPCRVETPNVVAVYEKYRDKGLIVIGVPVNDLLEATQKAMQDLGIHYPQVLDPSLRLAEKYNITGIPHLILFDPEGNIVEEGMREAQIEEVVSRFLK